MGVYAQMIQMNATSHGVKEKVALLMFAMKAMTNGTSITKSGKAMTMAATKPMAAVINQTIKMGPRFFMSTSQPRLNPSRMDLFSSTMARSA